jgi:hypothetical protein
LSSLDNLTFAIIKSTFVEMRTNMPVKEDDLPPSVQLSCLVVKNRKEQPGPYFSTVVSYFSKSL